MPILSPLTWQRQKGEKAAPKLFIASGIKYPPSSDVLDIVPDVLNQSSLGSCTTHGIAGWYMAMRKKAGLPVYVPSRLGIYYEERKREGTINRDAGAFIHDGFKVGHEVGFGHEYFWPYDISKFAEQPPKAYYDDAATRKIHDYGWIDNSVLNNIKMCIFHGQPFVMGFDVFKNFDEYQSGVLHLPTRGMQYLGGHCVFGVGYDDSKQAALIQNSWGGQWGIGGRFWMSYDYLTSLHCSDFYTGRVADTAA